MKAKRIINELLVTTFNFILDIEADILKAKGVKLSMTEVHVLEAIRNADLPTMTNISNKLRITVGTLTTSVKVLVQKKYVERYKDDSDKRRVLLRLTEQANKVLEIHDQFHDKMIDEILEDLKLDEDQVLIKSLEKINDYFMKKY